MWYELSYVIFGVFVQQFICLPYGTERFRIILYGFDDGMIDDCWRIGNDLEGVGMTLQLCVSWSYVNWKINFVCSTMALKMCG